MGNSVPFLLYCTFKESIPAFIVIVYGIFTVSVTYWAHRTTFMPEISVDGETPTPLKAFLLTLVQMLISVWMFVNL